MIGNSVRMVKTTVPIYFFCGNDIPEKNLKMVTMYLIINSLTSIKGSFNNYVDQF